MFYFRKGLASGRLHTSIANGEDTWTIWGFLLRNLRALLPAASHGSPLLCILPYPKMVYSTIH